VVRGLQEKVKGTVLIEGNTRDLENAGGPEARRTEAGAKQKVGTALAAAVGTALAAAVGTVLAAVGTVLEASLVTERRGPGEKAATDDAGTRGAAKAEIQTRFLKIIHPIL